MDKKWGHRNGVNIRRSSAQKVRSSGNSFTPSVLKSSSLKKGSEINKSIPATAITDLSKKFRYLSHENFTNENNPHKPGQRKSSIKKMPKKSNLASGRRASARIS